MQALRAMAVGFVTVAACAVAKKDPPSPTPPSPVPTPVVVPAVNLPVHAVISGPTHIDLGDLVILDATSSQSAQQFAWVLANSDKSFLPIDGGSKCVFASGLAQDYKFVLVAAGQDAAGKLAIDVAKWTVTAGTPTPVPPPGPPQPPPGPTPPPAPTTKATHIILFEDPANRLVMSTAQLNALQSTGFRSWCSANSVQWRQWPVGADTTNVAKEWKQLAAAAKVANLPTPSVAFGDDNGALLHGEALPADDAGLMKLVQTYAGK